MMKKEKVEEFSLLPIIEAKEKECREKIASAEKKAVMRLEKAKEEAKLLVEKTRASVTEREKRRFEETTKALENNMRAQRSEETEKLKRLEAELKIRLPLAAKEILRMILP